MKTKIILFTILFFPMFVFGQTWDYPIKPGSEEWKKFQNNQEKVEACQIPEEVLTSLPTEDLTELCLQYPLLYDVFAFDNLNRGLDKLYNDFNGIRELYRRKDITTSLTKRYDQKIRSLSFLNGNSTELEKGKFILSVDILEVLLSRCDIQNSTTERISKEILQNLVAGYEEKIKYSDYFKGAGFRINVYSRVHVIAKMDRQSLDKLPQKIKNPALFSGIIDEESLRMIDELSYQLIK